MPTAPFIDSFVRKVRLPTAIGPALAIVATCALLAVPASSHASDVAGEDAKHLVQDLHTAFGTHHARAVHAKGIILEGTFVPTAGARSLSRARLFKGATIVTVRFSNFTGFPDIADNDPNANPRGMAIKFGPKTAPALDVVTHNFDWFPTRSATEFGALLRAIGTSGPGVAAPTPLDQFLATHPIAKTFLTTQHPAPLSYATTAYFGVNAVLFTDRKGHARPVRYRFVPEAGEQYFRAGKLPASEYLQPELRQRVAGAPVRFGWYAQLGEAGDLLDDPSIAWPASRKLVKLGTITIDRVAQNTPAEDRALTFLPGRMPDGITAADPMLAIRSRAYPVSFHERQ